MKNIAIVYANLIVDGYKKFSEVPDHLKADVAEVLKALDCDELITDEKKK